MVPTEYLKRPYARLVIPDTDGTFTAEIVEFPGCIASGKSPTHALAKLEEVAIDWIAASLDQGQQIPEPMEAAGFSGKLVLRMPKSLHRRVTLCAERDGVSLNSFIVSSLAEAVGERAKPLMVHQHAPLHAVTNVSVQVASGAIPHMFSLGFQSPQRMATSVGPALIGVPVERESVHA
jgi:predicted RNase H-like HicB family nuclease